MKVGIPRALLFYEYSPLWISFFNNLGAQVVISDKTNKKILNQGTYHTVDDACIPVKLYHGHVLNLKDKVDYMFVPRIMGLYKKEYICPKFCGMPEMVKYSLNDLPNMINTKIDFTKSNNVKETVLEIGKYFCSDKNKILASYDDALNDYNEYKERLKRGVLPQDKDDINYDVFKDKNKKVMLMGHPYILYDEFLNMNVINKLRENGFDVVTSDMLDDDIVNSYAKKYNGKLFWTFFRKMIGSCLYLIENNFVDGVIYISSFGCGIDSVAAETVERRIRRNTDIPFMLMVLDEHSGEAGFNTRLEAFIDMLKWRIRDDNYVSTHG